MLHELTSEHFSRARPLFSQQTNHHLFCAGVLTGKYPGKVIVDNPEQPCSAMVFKPGMWCYLGGDPANAAFNQALGAALSTKKLIGEDASALLFIVPTNDWQQVLETLIADRLPIATPRFLYLANTDHFQAPPLVPDGFSLHFMDESLKAKVKGELPRDVQNVLELRGNSNSPDQAAFGYVALHKQTCVSWAMVDAIVGTHGEIGLFTEPLYRRQGLGMATSGATISYGLSHGLTNIHWDVVSHNTASCRMAEKHGLLRSLDYDQNLIIFGQMAYLANQAYHHLDNHKFQATLDVCEALFTLENGVKHAHFLSGAAWAGLNQKEKALQHLNQALDYGWSDLSEMENQASLEIIRGTKEWDAITTRAKSNIKTD